jgi:hypothetical protein
MKQAEKEKKGENMKLGGIEGQENRVGKGGREGIVGKVEVIRTPKGVF